MRGHVRLVSNHRRQSNNKTFIQLQIFNHQKYKIGVVSHIYVKKTLHKCRIQKCLYGPLIFIPLDGQTKGGVVVCTTNGDNLGGSSYLCL